MKRGLEVMAALLVLVLLVALPMTAQRPAGTTSYRVSLLLYPGDDAGALATQVATIYRGKLEGAVDAAGTFTIALSESMATMIARDPHVRSVEKLDLGAAVTTEATATGAIGTNAVTEWKLGDYQYDGSGNIKKIGNDVFVYDSRSRLTRGDAGAGHKQEYTYDGFGNVRTIITDAPGPIATNQTSPYKTSVAVNPKTNRAEFPGTDTGNPIETDPLTGQAYSMAAQYDATGNVIALQINDNDTFQYDGLGRLTKARIDGAWRAYVYTASDERIGTIALTEENGSEQGSSWTIRDIEGKVLRRYAKSGSTWTWNEDYIYRGSQMLAAELPGQTKHFHLDHLGTPRLVTDSEGVEISRHTYYPFGYEVGAATSGEKQFTGHERDSPTLDYMHARYYNPSMGRFLSVDPGKDWDPQRPQSWNMYSYVRNNPINSTDPTGRCQKPVDGDCTDMTIDVVAKAGTFLENLEFTMSMAWATPEGRGEVAPPAPNGMVYAVIPVGFGSIRGPAFTKPTLPPKTLAAQGEVTIKHNYRSGDHGPAHAHVEGGGPPTRIGPKGKPILDDPPMTSTQRAVYEANRTFVRRAINKIGRWLDYMGL
ncbi:MAG: hypothetical protein M3O61_15030 [Gemmatimonadota bacterium]|nr:hypothetical protein [Gemmatimonadota bacterium]